jgi:regulator of nonsense transcripts 2
MGDDSPSMAAGPSQPAPPSSTSLPERDKKRLNLRRANIEIWKNGPKPPTGPLDSNMKKNTGFIKRIRQSLGAESKDQLLKEIETLNLDKYIEEIILAVAEGLGRCTGAKDCIAAAEVRLVDNLAKYIT